AILLVIAFMLGVIVANAFQYFQGYSKEQTAAFSESCGSKIMPSGRISREDIHIYPNEVCISLKEPYLAYYTDTGSMEPMLGRGAKGIEIQPKGTQDIHTGDIVSYRSEYANGLVVHQVYNISYDENDWYAVMKGINNKDADPGRVRFNQINKVLAVAIY
ncbi:MAG: hypothetical protein Q8R04_07475, partial [Nanoarchaeota archaeon]|nr:hypothetical protein [Nanoarchaeota archaeon]